MFEVLNSLVNWYLTHLGQVLTGTENTDCKQTAEVK